MMSGGIATDCLCDLSEGDLRAYDVDLICSYVAADSGRFRDGDEITSENLLEYMEDGGQKAEDEITVTRASATVSGNCGPGMVGASLIRK